LPAARGAVRCRRHHLAGAELRAGRHSLEDMTVAADPDPYFALPSLFGAPAYARPPKAVPESERPFNADDLPIAAEQTEEERALAQTLQASGSYQLSDGLAPVGASHGAVAGRNGSNGSNGSGGVGGRRFSLRALTDRLGPGPDAR
jgi:hypothetical protein